MSTTVPVPPELLHENRRLLIALPWYRYASPLTTVALLNLFDRTRMSISISFGDAFIAHARNKLATKFLESKFEWMLMLDDDTVPPCGNAAWFKEHTGLHFDDKFTGLNAVERLLSHNQTIVGATYFGRHPGAHPVFAGGKERSEEMRKRGPVDEVIPCKWVGTGCLLFHRTVFEDIERKFPHLSRANNHGMGQWFTSSEHDLHQAVADASDELVSAVTKKDIKDVIQILETGRHRAKIHSGLGMGEDVQVCVRATQAGHQPHVDLGLWCGHVGPAVFPNF